MKILWKLPICFALCCAICSLLVIFLSVINVKPIWYWTFWGKTLACQFRMSYGSFSLNNRKTVGWKSGDSWDLSGQSALTDPTLWTSTFYKYGTRYWAQYTLCKGAARSAPKISGKYPTLNVPGSRGMSLQLCTTWNTALILPSAVLYAHTVYRFHQLTRCAYW